MQAVADDVGKHGAAAARVLKQLRQEAANNHHEGRGKLSLSGLRVEECGDAHQGLLRAG